MTDRPTLGGEAGAGYAGRGKVLILERAGAKGMVGRSGSALDRELGMERRITRRDLLHGLAAGALTPLAAALLGVPARAAEAAACAAAACADPPARTGLRGSNEGSFEVAHAARDGARWDEVADSGEQYDLAVVGAGLSGLAAAYFYRARTSPAARILILDNHDDFGGHARRNEFRLDGRLHLLNGGTLEIDSPRPYSAVADGLLRELGVDVPALLQRQPELQGMEAPGKRRAMFLDRETFGADKLLVGRDGKSWAHFLADSPLSPRARADLQRLEEDRTDYLPGKTSAQKKDLLSRISYRDYLRDVVQVDPQVLALHDADTKGWWGVGIDAVSALDCWGIGLPDVKGFGGLGLDKGAIPRMGPTAAGYASTGGSYSLHFPDGNATIARLLVRSLIAGVAPGSSVADVVTARFDYGRLDRADAAVRLRLGSTVVRVRHAGGMADRVEITYVRDGRAWRTSARHCVLACYNMVIPALCPELPESQKAALHALVKTPLVYSSVALRRARPLTRSAAQIVIAPGCYHSALYVNPQIRLGGYDTRGGPTAPALVHLQRAPCQPGLPEIEQNRAGRRELLATSFETFERRIREQLGRIYGPFGLDPAADITAITVNRWPHGYAPEYNPLFDPDMPPEQRPHVLGRARLGRIAIANSDSGGAAYTDVAIDQGDRAVRELLDDAA